MAQRQVDGRHDLLEAIQGYYAAEVLLQFNRLGILATLTKPTTADGIAKRHGLDCKLLTALLEFVSRTTEVLLRDCSGRYRLGRPNLPEMAFQLEKFVGAYGPSLCQLQQLLSGRRIPMVDQKALASAFALAGG